jgi:pre-mRNA-splicing helicase BRR2
MLKSPGLYGVGADYEDDKDLVQKRADIIHTAAAQLEKCHLVKYERSSGKFSSTELGRIASHYYITHSSMATYGQHLKPTTSTLELFRIFALSNEFKYLPVGLIYPNYVVDADSFISAGAPRGKYLMLFRELH